MTEWKTIETAPKDGTEILVCIKGRGKPFMVSYQSFDSWWKLNSHDWEERVKEYPSLGMALRNFKPYWQSGDYVMIDELFHPTHWQPLPSPPGEDA